MPRGRADLRNHGAAYGCSWRWLAGYVVFGRACVTAERNDSDFFADGRLPFGPLGEADLRSTKRCPPVLIRRSDTVSGYDGVRFGRDVAPELLLMPAAPCRPAPGR